MNPTFASFDVTCPCKMGPSAILKEVGALNVQRAHIANQIRFERRGTRVAVLAAFKKELDERRIELFACYDRIKGYGDY